MEQILSLPVFGIILSIACFAAGVLLKRRLPRFAPSPLFTANVLLILVLHFTPLTMEQYLKGGNMILLFIVPATTILAVKIYRRRAVLKANVISIIAGCIAGSAASLLSVSLLCRAFGIDKTVGASLLPKSVTAAIALELSENHGGLGGLTVSAVILTGMFCAAAGPFFIKTLKLKDPVAAGLAMGASGHAIGTSA
ncbi:MAG: LrgB family protein, partial [Treponema sp.]|nr:LrgB family protein [Treponema sp.]